MKNTHLVLVVFFGILSSGASGNTMKAKTAVSMDRSILNVTVDRSERYKAIRDNIISYETYYAVFPILEIIKEATKRVLRAFDLVMQRLQRHQLKIQTTLEGMTSKMSKLKLDEINGWVKEKKEIFDKYYAELWSIKDKINKIKKIKTAALTQANLIARLGKILTKFEGDGFFSIKELDYIGEVYTGMLSENLDILNSLKLLIFDNKMEVQDGKRLEMILADLGDIDQVGQDFNGFTDKLIAITVARGREANELEVVNEYLSLAL